MKKKPPIPDNFTEEYIAVGGIEAVSYTHLFRNKLENE